MQIHELNAGTPAAADFIPMDNGSDTYKTTADKLIPTFTSGDSLTPTGWTDVAKLTTGSTLGNLFGAISTMIKNVRYLFAKFGTTDISSIGDGTVTGAISTLNSNFSINNIKYVASSSDKTSHTINVPNNSLRFLVISSTSTTIHAYGIVATTSAGSVNIETMQTSQGITLTAATGAITVNVGSTARPLQILDIAMRGSNFCTLS